jgi:hypothetical protein
MLKFLGLMCFLVVIFSAPPAKALSPEEAGIKRWFDVVKSGNSALLYEAACYEAAVRMGLVDGVTDGSVTRFSALAALLQFDYSRLNYQLLIKEGNVAYVRVTGVVGEPKSLINPAKDWVPFERVNRRRGVSDIAVAVYERGAWRHCDYLTFEKARLLIARLPNAESAVPDIQGEYNLARSIFTPSEAKKLIGNWEGSYVCKQGITGITLRITHLPDGHIGGLFEFYPIEANPNIPKGASEIRVLVGPVHTFIQPIRWVKRPRGYQFVNFIGKLNEQSSTISGKIDSDGCSEFYVKRM